MKYFPKIELDEQALLAWLTKQQELIEAGQDYEVDIDDAWSPLGADECPTIERTVYYLTRDTTDIVKNLDGRYLEFYFTDDLDGGTYAFACHFEDGVTLVGPWQDLRKIGERDLLGPEAFVKLIEEAIADANQLTETLMNLSPSLWSIQATINRTGLHKTKGFPEGWTGSRQVPTFFLDSRVQGTLTQASAEQIARTILLPFADEDPSVTVSITAVRVS